MEIADLRGRTIVVPLSLGGFREDPLSKLQYCHVKIDVENGTIPIPAHVDVEITKGKYADHDTFSVPKLHST